MLMLALIVGGIFGILLLAIIIYIIIKKNKINYTEDHLYDIQQQDDDLNIF